MRQNKAEKHADLRIEAAYRRTCTGVQIDIMDIGKVFKVGREAVKQGASDAELDAAIAAFVNTIKRN